MHVLTPEEFFKTADISSEEAKKSLDKYKALGRNKPTVGQLGRYGVVGAVAAPIASAITDSIAGNKLFGGGTPIQRARNIAGKAVAGAFTSGAIPLVRQHFDQKAEKKVLEGYLKQKVSFATSYYDAGIGSPSLQQASQIPPFKMPSLRRPLEAVMDKAASLLELIELEKLGHGGATPAGVLSASRKVGLPKMTAPSGPSIAQVAKPIGFGTPLPGAIKSH